MRMQLETKDRCYVGEGDRVYWLNKDNSISDGVIEEDRVEYGEFYEASIKGYGYCMSLHSFWSTFYYIEDNIKKGE